MYQKGQVQWGIKTDSQTENYDAIDGAYLQHSCDEWVIGGQQNILWLIEDLQKLLEVHK